MITGYIPDFGLPICQNCNARSGNSFIPKQIEAKANESDAKTNRNEAKALKASSLEETEENNKKENKLKVKVPEVSSVVKRKKKKPQV